MKKTILNIFIMLTACNLFATLPNMGPNHVTHPRRVPVIYPAPPQVEPGLLPQMAAPADPLPAPENRPPVQMDRGLIAILASGCPHHTLDNIASFVSRCMTSLENAPSQQRLDLRPPCNIPVEQAPDARNVGYRVMDVVSEMTTRPALEFGDDVRILEAFCSGYHDCCRFSEDFYSAQQLIERQGNMRNSAVAKAYAAGVNEAAHRFSPPNQFPWTDPQYFFGSL